MSTDGANEALEQQPSRLVSGLSRCTLLMAITTAFVAGSIGAFSTFRTITSRQQSSVFAHRLRLPILSRRSFSTLRSPTMSAATEPALAPYENLATLLRELSALSSAMGILGWDEQVMMPEGAAKNRGAQKAALAGVAHEKASSPALDAAIAAWEGGEVELPDQYAKANVRDARRSFAHTARVSKKLAMEREAAETEGYAAWAKARKENDWDSFAPVMENGLRIAKEYAVTSRPEMGAYDAAIDMFERGMTAERLGEIFGDLEGPLKSLLDKVSAARASGPKVLDCLKGGEKWGVAAQERLCKRIAEKMAFSFHNGRMDTSLHPFTGGCVGDVRITTRYSCENPWEGIQGTVHEVGHALYEQGRNAAHEGLPVSEALSMGSHESQSLFWERMVAQRPEFWEAILPMVHEELPHTAAATAKDFAFAVNQVNPEGLIRVDADELSYPFHIILRFKIERGLFDGSISVNDLPNIWNGKMKEYFGVDVPSDAKGCLQDVHWPSLAFGYFPSYTVCQWHPEHLSPARCIETVSRLCWKLCVVCD